MVDSLPVFAKQLRRNMTDAELLLWRYLRGHHLLGAKFKRQQPLGNYIVDFVCFEAKVVVEVDGGQHLDNRQDQQRDAWLRSQGLEVLRFWNNEVLEQTEAVLEKIAGFLPLSPTLSHKGRGSKASTISPLSHKGGGSKASAVLPLSHKGGGSEASAISPLSHKGEGSEASAILPLSLNGGESKASTISPLSHKGGGSEASAMLPLSHKGRGSEASAISPLSLKGGGSEASTISPLSHKGRGSEASAILPPLSKKRGGSEASAILPLSPCGRGDGERGETEIAMDRLRWRCRRGLLELDIVLGRFVEQYYACLDEAQRIAFDALLDMADTELWDMVAGRREAEPHDQRALLEKIRAV